MRLLTIIAALVALALAATAVAVPGLARAQQDPTGGSPFAPLPPAQQEPAPAPQPQNNTPTTPTSPNDEDLSTASVLGLFAAGILAIVAVAFLIMRDARRSLPRRKRRGSARGGAKPQPKRGRGAKASATAATAAAGASGKRAPPPPPRKRRNKKQQKRRSR